MICPNCGHRFKTGVDPEIKKEILSLYAQGFSLRQIEKKLDNKISFSTASRVIKEFVAEKITDIT